MPQYLSPGVYVEEMEPAVRPVQGVATAVAAFVGLAAQGPYNAPTLITNWSQFTSTFGDFLPGTYLAHAVYGFFNNGGSVAYVVRIGEQPAERETNALAEIASGTDRNQLAYRVQAIAAGAAGNGLSVEVADPGEGAPEDAFKLLVKRGEEVVENFDAVTVKKGRQNVATQVNQHSKLIRLEELAAAKEGQLDKRPATGTVALAGGGAIGEAAKVGTHDYVGDAAARTGFAGLEAVDEVTMVAMPDLVGALVSGAIDLEGFKAVQLGLISHCESMGNRMAILDTPPGLSAQQAKEWRVDGAGYDSKFATMYWPQIKVFDPSSGTNVFVPPSGHMAGIWCRSDSETGVHKAPANEVVRGAVELELNLTRGEHDVLNPVGLNCIRSFPGRGIRVWGARTLSSDQAWRYINVRRVFNYVESSILANTDWVVFEPNDPDLWGRIRRTISGFLYTVWADGALFGTTAAQAFYVKCDDETNPSEVIESGTVVTEIGIAPVKPAEFVVFRLANMPTGTSAIAE